MQEKVSVIYHKYCPFAQRALLTAIEKDVNAEFISTGLDDSTKTPFFREAYAKSLGRVDNARGGKVPVLIHGDRHLTES